MLLQILDTEATFCVGVGWSSCSSMGQAISVVCAAALRFRGATKPTLQYASTHRFGLLVSRHSVQRDDWKIISKHFIKLKKLYTTETVSSAFSLITKLDVCVCSFWDMRSSSMLSQLFIVYNNIELHILNCNEVLTRQIHKKTNSAHYQ